MYDFSIIIPTRNREHLLKRCLYFLFQQKKQNFEIIVINDSLKKLNLNPYFSKKINIIESNSEKGPGYCRNIGIKMAATQYIAFIDDDCFTKKNWSERITQDFIKKDLDVGKGYIVFDGNSLLKFYLKNQIWGYNINNDFISTCNTFFKKNILLNNTFDTDFDFAFEDVDLFNRLKKLYKITYLNNATVTHHGKTSLKNIIRSYFLYGKGLYKYKEKQKNNNKKKNISLKYLSVLNNYIRNIKKVFKNSLFCLFLLIIFVLIDIMKVLSYKMGFYYEQLKK